MIKKAMVGATILLFAGTVGMVSAANLSQIEQLGNTPPLVMNWKMTVNLVASIGTSMKTEAMDSCFALTVLTISGDILNS